jgi:hypothetical protein
MHIHDIELTDHMRDIVEDLGNEESDKTRELLEAAAFRGCAIIGLAGDGIPCHITRPRRSTGLRTNGGMDHGE